MRWLVRNLRIPLAPTADADFNAVARQALAKRLGLAPSAIEELVCVRRAIDARKKPKIFFVCDYEVRLLQPPQRKDPEMRPLAERESALIVPRPEAFARRCSTRVIVVGAGPAGLFAALALAEAGAHVVLIERGKPIEARMRDIGRLRSRGVLDPESNLCFGEGGAGAYTDGKLYTRIKHPFRRWVLARFVEFGAPKEILVDAHPHLGTDRLVRIVRQIRQGLLARGVEIRFETKMQAVLVRDGRAYGVRLANGEELAADAVVIATGHSARDSFEALQRAGCRLEPKPFAVGVRIEHPQDWVNRTQYGSAAGHPWLGAAEYRLSHQVSDPYCGRRGVYSFCMCPGGLIVPAATEPDGVVVNGMSNAKRAGRWANAGIVVQVFAQDLAREGFGKDAFCGVRFQRALEKAAFRAAGGGFRAPAARVDAFVAGRSSDELAPTRFKPGAVAADLRAILPDWIVAPLVEALRAFDAKMPGFVQEEANLFAVESRTSSPIRVARNERAEAEGIAGLYPVGEGAGWAGGIVSAAVDGLRAAASIIARAR